MRGFAAGHLGERVLHVHRRSLTAAVLTRQFEGNFVWFWCIWGQTVCTAADAYPITIVSHGDPLEIWHSCFAATRTASMGYQLLDFDCQPIR
jgi:hypothetical protein